MPVSLEVPYGTSIGHGATSIGDWGDASQTDADHSNVEWNSVEDMQEAREIRTAMDARQAAVAFAVVVSMLHPCLPRRHRK